MKGRGESERSGSIGDSTSRVYKKSLKLSFLHEVDLGKMRGDGGRGVRDTVSATTTRTESGVF